MYMCAKLLQGCLTLCDPMDCSPPGFSAHAIFQARIREWDLPDPGKEPASLTSIIELAGRLFTPSNLGSPSNEVVWHSLKVKFAL